MTPTVVEEGPVGAAPAGGAEPPLGAFLPGGSRTAKSGEDGAHRRSAKAAGCKAVADGDACSGRRRNGRPCAAPIGTVERGRKGERRRNGKSRRAGAGAGTRGARGIALLSKSGGTATGEAKSDKPGAVNCDSINPLRYGYGMIYGARPIFGEVESGTSYVGSEDPHLYMSTL